ncbi:MAG: 23S rRNA (adenine(2503)-C(2))-methyltransferase RlmN [bacterium]|nr:23S rRNA (adenine(2503)-C(2))-methyltransferase RlmN [bacterium]
MNDITIEKILATEPAYRLKQIYSAWFDPSINGYAEITTLSKELREQLKDFPWLTVKPLVEQRSKVDNTRKVLFQLHDGQSVESVLMGREGKKASGDSPVRWTICISSQVGCAMGCTFCSTGKMGFKRNLLVGEIVDQVRFWQRVLAKEDAILSNIVLMGQGEPFLNYLNVRDAINIVLANTLIGPSKITISTVGVQALMDKMLVDKDFPSIRFALSLHSAIEEKRGSIIPSHKPGFIKFLVDWSQRYHKRFTSRALFFGIEYLMMHEVNDDEKHLKALIKLASKLGRVRINLIPYNYAAGDYQKSAQAELDTWHRRLLDAGFVCTVRHSQGQDIAAACGQLKNLVDDKK